MDITLERLYEMIKAANKAAKTRTAEAYASFPENFRDVAVGIEAMDVAMHSEITKAVEAERVQQAGRSVIDLSRVKENMQYTVGGLAKVLGKSTETVRRWSNDPTHPLKPHLRRAGSHQRFYLGSEVLRALTARMA